MKVPTLLACAAGLSLLLTGCLGPTPGVRTGAQPLETYTNLVYVDRSLAVQIPCEVLKATKTASGRTEVYARFVNRRNKAAECQIQLKFKGDDGSVVDQTGWMPFLLSRREVTEFRHKSLAEGAADFVLLLREAR